MVVIVMAPFYSNEWVYESQFQLTSTNYDCWSREEDNCEANLEKKRLPLS